MVNPANHKTSKL